jgi:hypothetical protein
MGQNLEVHGVSFLDYFSQREDPRAEREKLYPPNKIFLVTITVPICGGETAGT